MVSQLHSTVHSSLARLKSMARNLNLEAFDLSDHELSDSCSNGSLDRRQYPGSQKRRRPAFASSSSEDEDNDGLEQSSTPPKRTKKKKKSLQAPAPMS